MSGYRYIKFFEDVRVGDVSLVGGKNASLGELLSFGIAVPLGFAVTAELGPPKSADIDLIKKKASLLKGWVDAVNITDNRYVFWNI